MTTTSSNQRTYQPYCERVTSDAGTGLLTLLYLIEVMQISLAVFYLWKTRNVPAIVNETMVIGPAMLFSVVSIVTLGIVLVVVQLNPIQSETLVTVAFIVIITFGNNFYFFNKFFLGKLSSSSISFQIIQLF